MKVVWIQFTNGNERRFECDTCVSHGMTLYLYKGEEFSVVVNLEHANLYTVDAL